MILIDGHAILHRAFHALPPLATSKGEAVGAVFGFCSMLLRVIQDLKPGYLAVAFDLPKPTFRQKLYAPYQAQRPEMAEELSSQVETTHQVLKAMEIPIFEKEGYEADDLIGTLAKQALSLRSPDSDFFGFRFCPKIRLRRITGQAREVTLPRKRSFTGSQGKHSKIGRTPRESAPRADLEVIIVTGDRDMLQLINDRVKVFTLVKGIIQTILYDENLVEEKYGLKPKQWVDFKALMGDPSDNYPGVAGIGPKTATDLLKKYGTLEKIYQNLDELPEKQTHLLKEGREQVELAETLAKIAIDAPVKLDLLKCKLQDLKNPKVEKLFKELEFKSLWERIKKNGKPEEKHKIANDQLSLLN